MSIWSQLNFQEGCSLVMERLNYFHDYAMLILVVVLVYVTYMFGFVIFSRLLDKVTVDSHLLEAVWTVLPMLVLICLALPSLYVLYLNEEFLAPVITVKVVAHQWYWEYEYTMGSASYDFNSYMVHELSGSPLYHNFDVDNRLSIPSKSPVLFLVTSADVLHSWTVPAMGIKVDAIPGRLNYLTCLPFSEGLFFGQCSEICGSNHSFMPIVVEVLTLNSFLTFVKQLPL